MNKKFTFLMTAMALIFAILGSGAEAWGQTKESYTITIDAKKWSSNGTQTLNNVDWTLTNDGDYYGYDGTKGQQVGSGSKPAKNMSLSTNGISGTISSVKINTSGASSVNANVSVSVGGTQWGNAKTITDTASDYTFTGTGSGEIVFTWAQTSSKALYFKSITVEYETAPSQTLESIAVQTPPTKTTYFADDNFDPAGLVITAAYDDASTEDIAYEGNEDKFTFEPSTSTALTNANTNVIITYGGKSCSQDITVNLNKLATPSNLQATNVTSTSATLTWDAVANASSYEVKLKGVAKTATTNSLLVEDLTASTAYTWTVKAKGDNTTYEDSEESESSDFTTLAPPSNRYTVTFNAGTNGTCSTTELIETSPGAGVTLPEVTPNTGYQFVGWATTNTATEADAGEAGETYHPTEDITLYAVYNEVYTINYMVNGVNTDPQVNVEAGTPLVFPEVAAPDADHVFCGWVTTAIEGTQPTAPKYVNIEGLTATQNTTFYAVFAEKSEGDVTWVKKSVSEISEGGVYAIITTDGHAFNGNISSGHGQVTTTAFSFTNNVAASAPSGTCEITFEAVTGGFKMYNADNGYLYASAASSGKLAWHNTEDSYWYYNSSDNGNWMYKSNSARLRSYNNASIRTYSANNGDVLAFAKKTQDITYTYYTNVVVKVLTSIEIETPPNDDFL